MVDLRRTAAVATLGAALAAAGCGGSSAACADVATPKPHAAGTHRPPATPLDAAKRWTLTFKTSCGSFAVQLMPRTAPHAAASLVALARSGFFHRTIF